MVVHVIPLLVETGQQDTFDVVIVVDVDPATQVERLQQRDGATRTEAEARLAAQASREQRSAAADVIIDNSAGCYRTEETVEPIWPNSAARATPE